MDAIVLAGGLGTRLRHVTCNIPKPMAPVGQRPFLEYILKHLQHNDVKNVILSVGYKWRKIHEHFGSEFCNLKLAYSVEDTPLGTGGAIKQAMNQVTGNELYIINGDTFFDIDLKSLQLDKNCKIKLSLKSMHHFDRYGCVQSDINGFVTNFTEKSYQEVGDINGGVYLISKEIFSGYDVEEKFSFEEFIINNFTQLKAMAKIFDGYFIDIGVPSDYEKAQIEMKNFI